MSIFKNDIPILEYDTDPLAVIMPDYDHIDMRLPKKAVFAFLFFAMMWIVMRKHIMQQSYHTLNPQPKYIPFISLM